MDVTTRNEFYAVPDSFNSFGISSWNAEERARAKNDDKDKIVNRNNNNKANYWEISH